MTTSHDQRPQTWEARALAAERTVEVLKRKVVDLYNGGGSNIQQTLERARVREAESRRRQELMELRNAELLNYSARLEGEVAARTRELQTILDNVVFGFLVVGANFAVRAFTRSCLELSASRARDPAARRGLGSTPRDRGSSRAHAGLRRFLADRAHRRPTPPRRGRQRRSQPAPRRARIRTATARSTPSC